MPKIEAADLMLATLVRAPFSREAWIFELKYDGYRCLVRKTGNVVELISRNAKSFNASFPEMVEAVAKMPGTFTWDAELTVDEPNGQSSFERLQKRARTKTAISVRAVINEHPARLYLFDILSVGKKDLRHLPLSERKQHLRDSFDDTSQLVYPTGIVEAGEFVFEQVVAHDFEGMVAKRLDAPYQRGRSNDWQKVKFQGYSRQAALGWGRTSSVIS